MATPREPHHSPSPKAGGGGWVFDIITVIFLIAAVAMIFVTILIINNPDVSFNPFPLAALPTEYRPPTSTITPTPLPSHTPSVTPFPPTPTPTQTNTPPATDTPTPSVTPTLVVPGIATNQASERGTPNTVQAPSPTVNADFPFIAREVRYERNTNDQGCNWMSIAGNVTGRSGEPVTDLAVEIKGTDFEFIRFTGNDPLFGASGFEVKIDETPRRDEFIVNLIGPTGVPVSDFVIVTTSETCDRNVAIVEFVQVGDY